MSTKEISEPEYDPITCITAGELRIAGFTIPPEVPDCGWIRRGSIKMEAYNETTPDDVAQGKMKVGLRSTFTEPFQWIEVDFSITPESQG